MLSPVEGTKWIRGSVLVMLEVQSSPQLAPCLGNEASRMNADAVVKALEHGMP